MEDTQVRPRVHSEAFRVAILEPLRFPTIPLVVGVLAATKAATAQVLSIGVDDFVLAHVLVRSVAEQQLD